MTEKPEMPDAIWAWYFMASKRDDAISGGWTDSEDRREVKFLRSTPAREAAPDILEALKAAEESIATFIGVHKYPIDSGAGDILRQVSAAIAKTTGEASS